jgi:hypothetical protein
VAVSGVACSQGVEGSGMAGPSDTLGPWPPLAIRYGRKGGIGRAEGLWKGECDGAGTGGVVPQNGAAGFG